MVAFWEPIRHNVLLLNESKNLDLFLSDQKVIGIV